MAAKTKKGSSCEKGDIGFVQPRFSKRADHPLEKVPLFIGHGFSCKRGMQAYFKFHTKRCMDPIYWTSVNDGVFSWILH